MNRESRPIYLPRASGLNALRQRVQTALDDWAREWIRGDAHAAHQIALRIDSVSQRAQPAIHLYESMRIETGSVWFRSSATDRSSFGGTVVGAELLPGFICADEWIIEVVDAAWTARNRALCAALLSAPVSATPPESTTVSAPPAALFAVGSGAVQVSCEALGLQVIADSAVWRSLPPTERGTVQRRPALIPLDRALRRGNAQLDVMLGSVEVELPKLMDLRCGDVLRLPQRLDREITVLCGGKVLARAALGERQGRKCVQLASNP